MSSKVPSATDRVYEDFQPIAHWVTEESKTLEIHLPEFRKEHLRVQLDNLGSLKISGERPLHGNKWSRFILNLPIPKDYDFNDIHAKFVNNVLRVILPKKIVPTKLQDPTTQKIVNDHAEDRKKGKERVPGAGGVEANKENVNKSPTNESGNLSRESYQFGVGGYALKLRKPRRMRVVNVAVAIGILVAAGAYVVYKLRTSISE